MSSWDSNDGEWIIVAAMVAVTLQMVRLSIDLISVASQPVEDEVKETKPQSSENQNRPISPLLTKADRKVSSSSDDEEWPLLSSDPSGSTNSALLSHKMRKIAFAIAWIVLSIFYFDCALSATRSVLSLLLSALLVTLTNIIFQWRDPEKQRYGHTSRFFHIASAWILWSAFSFEYITVKYNDSAKSFSWITVGAATLQLVLTLVDACCVQGPPRQNRPSQSDESDKKSALSSQQFMTLLRPYFWPDATADSTALMNRSRAVLTWVCVAGSKVCNLVSPLFLGWASTALAHADYQRAIYFSCGYAAISWTGNALKEAQSLVYLKVAQAAYVQLAVASFGHLHSLSLDWHLRKKMGLVLRSMSRGISACDTLMKYLFLWLLPALAECISVCLIFATYFSFLPLAVTVFYFVFVYTVWTILVTLWRKKFRKQLVQSDNEMENRFVDSMMNFETVKFFTAEAYEKEQFAKAVACYQAGSVNVQSSLSFLNMSQQVILQLCMAASLALTAHAIQLRHDCCLIEAGCESMLSDCCLESHCGGMQVGDFVAVLAFVNQLFGPLNFLGSVYNSIVMALIDLTSMSELLSENPDVTDAPDALQLPKTNDSDPDIAVEFDNVTFHYPTQPSNNGLKGLSFQMKRGTTTAIVGPTGAGKTTISRLLFRFYDTLGGAVKVNGVDVRTVTQHSLRGAMGVVPQAASLFNDTLEANILYGSRDATREQLIQAATDAQLLPFIESLPEQWDTLVGDRGLKLSGGEKQRVAIARCLLKNPDFVLLDEATSALDTLTEKSVQEALDRLGQHRTVLVIAHRLGTIRNADQIVVLKGGVAAEIGTHDELMEKQGLYADMWNMQLHTSSSQSSLSSSP
ncbi:ATP-binding cassette, subfamily B (MDR/TAP), member 6 [Fistulifera solaris]|uniref:ATP-binding cassette, subfamily B (MDR/TAP), member 6 n=1 Tax=Fistulifera solaris TaxID=1519565 RepID=A0A1Z5JU69_FISSO|nr:ATP-binding cassette, subfamily B (MDR/TAP), member 6 [Fistulifera solaris]|eukprot:GAX17583.1 ATP-binding cassette, subfamily B (MDR/TAP), member 6 [Fistulifera solaris]